MMSWAACCLVLTWAVMVTARTRCRSEPREYDCATQIILNPMGSWLVGEYIDIMCREGYHLEGHSAHNVSVSIKCVDQRNNRGWEEELPACVPITCPPLEPGKYTVDVPENHTCYYGDKYTYACKGGYETDDDLLVVCDLWGNWSPDPPCCEPVCCGPVPDGHYTELSGNPTLYFGDYYKYECLDGYYTYDDHVTVCQADGEYSNPPPTCHEVICDPLLDGMNTVPVQGYSLEPLGQYTYECQAGYYTDDETCAVCLPCGELTIPPPNCTEIHCGKPGDGINTMPVPNDVDLTYPNSYTYSCEYGFVTDDELCVVCLKEGFSAPPPNCTAAMCGEPPAGCNTEAVTPGLIASPGATFTYSCSPGFIPYYEDEDNFEITCMSNADWSGGVTGPSCTMECDVVPASPGFLIFGIVPKTGCAEFYSLATQTSTTCPPGMVFDIAACGCMVAAACAVP